MIKLYYTLNRRKWNKDLLQLIILIFELSFSTEWEYGDFFVTRKMVTNEHETEATSESRYNKLVRMNDGTMGPTSRITYFDTLSTMGRPIALQYHIQMAN